MFGAWMFYYRASRMLGFGMLAVFVADGLRCTLLARTTRFGTRSLLYLAIGVFVVAWIAQFIGHKIEGRKPSFLTDLTYLLIGPAWVLAKVPRWAGILTGQWRLVNRPARRTRSRRPARPATSRSSPDSICLGLGGQLPDFGVRAARDSAVPVHRAALRAAGVAAGVLRQAPARPGSGRD